MDKIKQLGIDVEDEKILIELEETFPNDVDENAAYDAFKNVYQKYEGNIQINSALIVLAKKYSKSFQKFTDFNQEDKLGDLAKQFKSMKIRTINMSLAESILQLILKSDWKMALDLFNEKSTAMETHF